MKKSAILLSIVFLLSGCSTSAKVVIPDVVNTFEGDAKFKISNVGLVAEVKYENNENVDEGYVIKISPESGSKINKGKTVTVYVSTGPVILKLDSISYRWENQVGFDENSWNFSTPEIKKGKLGITLHSLNMDTAEIFDFSGEASLSSDFSNPVSIIMGEPEGGYGFTYIVVVDLKQLGSDKPNELSLKFNVTIGGKPEVVIAHLSMNW